MAKIKREKPEVLSSEVLYEKSMNKCYLISTPDTVVLKLMQSYSFRKNGEIWNRWTPYVNLTASWRSGKLNVYLVKAARRAFPKKGYARYVVNITLYNETPHQFWGRHHDTTMKAWLLKVDAMNQINTGGRSFFEEINRHYGQSMKMVAMSIIHRMAYPLLADTSVHTVCIPPACGDLFRKKDPRETAKLVFGRKTKPGTKKIMELISNGSTSVLWFMRHSRKLFPFEW